MNQAAIILSTMLGFMPVKFQNRLNTHIILAEVQNKLACDGYRQWQAAFNRRKQAILDDEVDYLSWTEFVSIKEGNFVPELEKMCESLR